MTILIVEDNASVRRLLRTVLNGLASEIWECADGADAAAAYAEHRPDVVLMDFQMPKMDGIAATRQLISLDASATVVMVTDHYETGLEREALQAGVCAFTSKIDLLEVAPLLEQLRLDGRIRPHHDQ